MYVSVRLSNHSANLFLTQLTDFVATGMDNKRHTGMILVDFQKAFDNLNHGVPLQKIKYFGFQTSVIKWFES